MCLLTYLPEGVQPDVEALRKGAQGNPDGHGFAIVIPQFNGGNGRILVRKAMKSKGLIREFAKLRAIYPDGPAIFHSRITTDGITDLFNCHPFMHSGDKRTVIGHNGILPRSVRPVKGDARSDTRIFAEEVAGMFKLNTLRGRQLAGEWMGSYNKIAILTVDPSYDSYGYIINESSGDWHDGVWYSNTSFRGYRATTTTTTGLGYSYADGQWLKWEKCEAFDCTAAYPSVNPKSLICTSCKSCAVCLGDPCECHLDEYQGKGSGKGSLINVGTVIGGKPQNGTTVKEATGSTSLDDYVKRAQEYWDAEKERELARQAAMGGDDQHFEVDPEDDPADRPMGRNQLEEVLSLVDFLNNGGDLEGMSSEDQLTTINAALSALESEGLIDDRGRVRRDLIKRGDPGDDQEVLALTAGPASE